MREWQRLERWIAQIVEMPFARLFAGQITPQEVAERLVQALEEGERIRPDGTIEVEGGYRILLHPAELEALRAAHPQIETILTAALESSVREMGLRLRTPASIVLEADAQLAPQSLRILPLRGDPSEPTREIRHVEAPSRRAEQAPSAHLILGGGRRTFELTAETVRIGRAADNDLILDDRTVSRHHALLKRRYRRYLLTDLGSRSGTRLNGLPVREAILRSGDRIKIGTVTMIYVEEG
jgi:hypothetical protein